MKKSLDTMVKIQNEKATDLKKDEMKRLDHEGRYMAEHKRFTFDVIDIPVDPLR